MSCIFRFVCLCFFSASENCNDVRIQNPAAKTGEYNITLPSGEALPIYCDFMAKHGYMFISKTALSSLTTLEGLYDICDHAVIRVLYDNSEQHEVEVAQLSMYRERFPLSFQLNNQTGFKRPFNWNMTPYLYLGFLPLNHASLRSRMKRIIPIQGYMAGGNDVIFNNCHKKPDSYMAFFGNDCNVTENDFHLRYDHKAWT